MREHNMAKIVMSIDERKNRWNRNVGNCSGRKIWERHLFGRRDAQQSGKYKYQKEELCLQFKS